MPVISTSSDKMEVEAQEKTAPMRTFSELLAHGSGSEKGLIRVDSKALASLMSGKSSHINQLQDVNGGFFRSLPHP